jgi:hypothetical protein
MDQRCQVCGSSPEVIHRHHIIPLKEGGPDILENIVFLCPKCHRKAEAGEISVSSLLNLAKERLTFEELIFSEELDEPFEAHIRLTLNHWADSEARARILTSVDVAMGPWAKRRNRRSFKLMCGLAPCGLGSSAKLINSTNFG